MERQSFIFYASFYNAIKEIPNENQLKIYQAITNFALNGVEPNDLNGIEKAVFILIKPQIIANNKRYENGCNGGRPKKDDKLKKKEIKKTNGFETQKPKQNQTKTEIKPNENENENENDNVNDNNKKESIKKKGTVALVKATPTPQAEVFEIFAKLYKQETNIDYLGKAIDYINLAKLIKKYGKALVIDKINWLLVGCKHRVFFFSKGMTDFNISTLTSQWDRILPKLTDEQIKEEAKRKKEEETKAKVMAELAKQGIKLEEGGNDVSGI